MSGVLSKSFVDQLHKYNVLSHSDMIDVFKRYKDGDNTARDELIMSNMRLVVAIAKQYGSSNVSIEDLVQEGSFGLMTAVERFDWRRGYRFSTYATWWIRQSIGQFILKKKRHVRLPAHAVTMQRYMISAAERYKSEHGRGPTDEELIDIVSAEKHIRVSKTVVAATSHSGRGVVSLQSRVRHGPATSEHEKTYEHVIQDETPSANPFENVCSHELLEITKYVLSKLSPKEAAIIRLRFGLCEDSADSDTYPITVEEYEDIMRGKGLT